MRIVTIIGARPQFIKTSATSRAFANAGFEELLLHTGQHYDFAMSEQFFRELGVQTPWINLNVGSGKQGEQTGRMLEKIERAIEEAKPDLVLVHGDTNSTLAGALAAAKMHIRVAHNEAGLRSFNRSMPEEVNRILTDHCSDLLFCPTVAPVAQLASEGITDRVYMVGDVMYDVAMATRELALERAEIPRKLGLANSSYLLTTLHRPYTVDNPVRFNEVMSAFLRLDERVILPLHPRSKSRLEQWNITPPANVTIVEPVGYYDMLALEVGARTILTDSGGVQKEAYFHGVPCLTLRPETEWRETVDAGWNIVVDTNPDRIVETVKNFPVPATRPPIFGDGHAAEKIANQFRRL